VFGDEHRGLGNVSVIFYSISSPISVLLAHGGHLLEA